MTTESMADDDLRMDMGMLAGAIVSRWLRILVVTLLLLALTYAILLFVPKMYESQAGILVETRENAFTQPTSGTTSTVSSVTAEAAVSSQIELIKSRDTLLRVIDQLKLRDVPEFNGTGDTGPLASVFHMLGRTPNPDSLDETVLNNLNDRLTVIRERDSNIISIFARSRDPQLAAQIANAVASAHVQRRADLSLQDTAEAGVWLEQEIVKLRQRVSDAETAVANYKVDNDLFSGTNNTSLLDQQLSDVAKQITDAQERRNTAQSRAALIRSLLESGQPIDSVPDVQNSVVIQQLSQTKGTLQGELAQREATLLPNHPTIKALKAQIGEIQQQINVEARRVVAALEAEARIEADLVTSLQGDLTSAKATASTATTSTVKLDELEREAKAQRDLLESYLLRYRDAIARSDSSSALPDVRVITVAAPTVTPASPKVSLILAAVAFVSIALQFGGIVFSELMSGRAIVGRVDLVEEVYEPEPVREFVAAVETPGAPVQAVAPVLREWVVEEPDLVADPPPPPTPTPTVDEVDEAPVAATEAPGLASEPPAATPEPPPETFDDLSLRPAFEPDRPTGIDARTAFMAAVAAAEAEEAEARARVPQSTLSEFMAETAPAPVSPSTLPDFASAETTESAPTQPAPETVADVPPAAPEASAPRKSGRATRPRKSHKAAAAKGAEAAAPLLAPSYEARARKSLEVSNLSADLALGRSRIVMIAGLTDHKDAVALADRLVADALHNGLSIARVDAGSETVSSEPGLTDLASELASFGDVVHRGTRDGLAEVPWGQQPTLERDSGKPLTLVEALTDIYEAVIVLTGPATRSSTASAFSGTDCRMVIVGSDGAEPGAIEAALSEAAALGYHPVQFMSAPIHHAEVA